jgi:hypothetical protein
VVLQIILLSLNPINCNALKKKNKKPSSLLKNGMLKNQMKKLEKGPFIEFSPIDPTQGFSCPLYSPPPPPKSFSHFCP